MARIKSVLREREIVVEKAKEEVRRLYAAQKLRQELGQQEPAHEPLAANDTQTENWGCKICRT